MVYIISGIALLAVALLYQYGFDEWPCVVCIQIRMWIALLVIMSVLGLALRQRFLPNVLVQLSVVMVSVGLIERSYLLLGTEKGFVFADCGFDAGLPSWFALEQWMPWLFRVEAACGYTPELLFGITMAESLMLLSVCLGIVSVSILLATFVKTKI